MKIYLQLAWRNLWRNKKRTIIASASVFFAVILAIFTRSMQLGSYDYMINASVSLYTGYLQVHTKGYWEKKSLNKSMMLSPETVKNVEALNNVTDAVPRLEGFCLASSKSITKVASVIGIDPVKENNMTNLKKKLVSGDYLNGNSNGLLIAEGLAKLLKVNVGDSIVLYGQGYHGVTAAGSYKIDGIVKFTLPDLNKTMVYLTLPLAQYLFGADNRITSLSVMIDNPKKLEDVRNNLINTFGSKYEVLSWSEMMPDLVQSIEVDNAGGIIMLGILYVVIGFGIFGTIMMMTAERRKEFGVLIAVGMKKWRLSLVSLLETIMLSLIGVIAGTLASIPLLLYLKDHPIWLTGESAQAMLAFGIEPILPFSMAYNIFVDQILVVIFISVLTAYYPVSFIRKLEPVKALRK